MNCCARMEVHSILDCAEMAARASLFRTESRWGLYHHRVDYPETDNDNWFCHTLLEKQSDGTHGITQAADRARISSRCPKPSAASYNNIRLKPALSPPNRSISCRLAHIRTSVPVEVDADNASPGRAAPSASMSARSTCSAHRRRTGTAYMRYDECWYCLPCEVDCPTGAITVDIPYLLR